LHHTADGCDATPRERIFSEDQRELICHQGVRDRDTEEPRFRTFWLITGVLLMGSYFLVNWTPISLVRGGFSAKTAALGSALLNVEGAVLGLG
jgi:hypothetical protein